MSAKARDQAVNDILTGKVTRRRRGGDPLRRPARRPRHAGNALSDLLSEVEGPGQKMRPTDRRPFFRAAPQACRSATSRPRQPRVAQSAWCARATRSRSTSPTARSIWPSPTKELAARREEQDAKGWKPAEPRKRKVSKALKAYALLATSAAKGAVRALPDED